MGSDKMADMSLARIHMALGTQGKHHTQTSLGLTKVTVCRNATVDFMQKGSLPSGHPEEAVQHA